MTIYHGDCREVLPLLGPVDLVLTDPPYGVAYQSNYRLKQFLPIAGDADGNIARLGLTLSLKQLRSHRHVYAFGRMEWGELPITSPVELIWDKGNRSGGNVRLPWGMAHEYIQFGVYVPSKANRQRGHGRLAARLRRGSVLSVPRIDGLAVQRHPTEKPVLLMRMLMESSSIIGDMVLDPFMGSGSTLVAAALESRKAIGIEIEERYCEIAAKRMAQSVMAL